MEILWKGTVSAEFRANRLKLCENCAFLQNFHIKKLGEITIFFAMSGSAFCFLTKKLATLKPTKKGCLASLNKPNTNKPYGKNQGRVIFTTKLNICDGPFWGKIVDGFWKSNRN